MKQLGSEEARKAFRDLLDEAVRGESAEISRNGKPVAVLVPADWYRTVLDYIGATTFTAEAAAFYARQREAGNRVLKGGLQVRVRDNDGKVHDERWTNDLASVPPMLERLRNDPLIAEVWVEPS
jgi:prevent-host-death family protein